MGSFARILLCLAALAGSAGAEQGLSARAIYQQLNALRVDTGRIYRVGEFSLRRDVVRLVFEEGKLAFLQPYHGRVTGAVFTGRGRALALVRDPGEKASIARFLGEPLVDQPFSRLYLRFTDGTGEELAESLKEAEAEAIVEPSFAEEWNLAIADLNPWHSLRILADLLSESPLPYFYAGIMGDRTGAFDILLDDRRAEQVLIGQSRYVEGARYYDIWASFSRSDRGPFPGVPFTPVSYEISTTIRNDLSLEGRTTAELKARRGGERLLHLELSRRLTLETVKDAEGNLLEFFQNEEIKGDELVRRGNDAVLIVLPRALPAGESFRLELAYKGSVISDAGNGVYFVGERGSWYPHISGAEFFVPFELQFRWPKRLELVVTGKTVEEGEEGEWRWGRWKSEGPVPVVGFNLGEYVSGEVKTDRWKVEVYANRQLERAVLSQFNRPVIVQPVPGRSRVPGGLPVVVWPDPPPSPAAVLGRVAQDITDAIRFYEELNGPFPFEKLAVAQIPGSFGQGWPGLLYLSTLSFLSPAQQTRAGIGKRTQAQFTELVPPHEVAHQWWGNIIGWASYRDQWIQEGLANYLALLYVNSKTPGDAELTWWLETYRKELTEKDPALGAPPEELGPLTLGYRLRTSKAPGGFTQVVYAKGTWVMHMLHQMLKEPGARDPDARFRQLLANILKKYRYREFSTEDFQREVEALMTREMDLEGGRSMDWFFDQWVRGTGIPRYSVEFTVRPGGAPDRFVVRGKLKQEGVPGSFIAPVPIYAPRTGAKPVLLGTVITSGPETSFQFTTRTRPRKLLIDPYLTLLCLRD